MSSMDSSVSLNPSNILTLSRYALLFFREDNRTDRRKELIVDELQPSSHSVVTDDLSINCSENNSSISAVVNVPGAVIVDLHNRIELDTTFL
mmetsp:Transcript_28386/g.51738  ORF Transcript_28386/g.51738 Transcript_28386/m.51738 type:complete len:92 (+) Transcript_28386:487-762(+)